MTTRRKVKNDHPYPAHWEVSSTVVIDRHPYFAGETIFAVRGIRGMRFRFLRHVRNPETGAEWVDAINLPTANQPVKYHAFHLERVRWVRQPRELFTRRRVVTWVGGN